MEFLDPTGDEDLAVHADGRDDDAADARAAERAEEVRGQMHRLVVLEVFEHTSFLGDHHAETFRMAMRNMLEGIHSVKPWAQGRGAPRAPRSSGRTWPGYETVRLLSPFARLV
ncbi:hypothetical protein [Streptomyces diacarni]|uniref:hypothetical protein n=1 Tax=Streptomyces diacarni TaxID=2800381 RepID=UPI003F4D30AE